MTTDVLSPAATIARHLRLIWRRAGEGQRTSAPAGSEHRLVVLSRHLTSQGVVTYARCTCGDLQIRLTGAGGPAARLVKVIHEPERPPGCRP
jgi:hypothetical protein